MARIVVILVGTLLLGACAAAPSRLAVPEDYLNNSGRDDVLSGGVTMISVNTPKGTFRVWTKRVGNNPRVKVLLLHGGPGATHEYFEAFDSYFPAAGIEYYYYDQLGSAYSDQPDAPELWDVPRFVEEVEQVRQALRLDRSNFYLLGQSCGGILAIEYALKYQQHLKGLIISNMMASVPAYNEYANKVLMPGMDQEALNEIKRLEAAGQYDNPRYMELLIPHHYVHHVRACSPICGSDPGESHLNNSTRKSIFQCKAPASLGQRKVHWDRTADLGEDRGTDIGDRAPVTHDGPVAPEMDVRAGEKRTLPLLSQRQPSGDL
jgi:proline iminopeptidase